ncbi:hypothetical protein SAZ10_09930 [Mesorhizobium sp. BAC0120]|uniref:hypothetical protein n=1 Tax=Mesorhizobium sp. BAC0120 TaxID=3090670 RepID=UPI00298C4E5B|nr:hypothetical protein [Mesorhizobium sp. BAC0120]MDW6022081.1 hypothetical protein [Mesorhizobium sp. BAC0120]
MTRLPILAASLGLAAAQASACDFHQTASKVDEMKVASTATDGQKNMSMPNSQSTQSTVVVKKDKAVSPAETK